MFGLGRTAALAIAVTLLGGALLGSVALGAFSPSAVDTFTVIPALDGTTAPANGPGADRLKAVLDGLVSKGVITQAQEDAILGALATRTGDGDLLKRLFANLFQRSAGYLGLDVKTLRDELPGKSLAEVANATAGKSRDGLVTALVADVNTAVDQALSGGRITQEQADKAKAAAPDHVAKFVDHTWPARAPKVRLPDLKTFIGDATAAARDYLGLTQQDLVTQLRAGKSLADIASATPGKSRDGLVAAITASTSANIDKAAAAGTLTAEQATALKARVGEAVGKLVDRAPTAGFRQKGVPLHPAGR